MGERIGPEPGPILPPVDPEGGQAAGQVEHAQSAEEYQVVTTEVVQAQVYGPGEVVAHPLKGLAGQVEQQVRGGGEAPRVRLPHDLAERVRGAEGEPAHPAEL